MPLTLTLISEAFPATKRGAAIGLWGGIAGLAVAAGPVVGGAVAGGLDWHRIFWLNVPVGVVLIPLAAARLTESFGPRPQLDILGLCLAAAGVLGLTWGPRAGQRRRVGKRAGRRHAAGRIAAARRVRRVGGPHAHADGAAGALPPARVRERQRGELLHVRRALRGAVPDGAVLPDRAGPLAAGGGRPAAALDGDADDRRAHRRRAPRPLGAPPLHGPRPRAPGGRSGVGGLDRVADRPLHRARRRADRRRGRHLAVLPDGG